MTSESERTFQRITIIAVALTTGAEIVYFTVWGLFLFPEGNVIGKLVWTTTCGIAMGLVIAALTFLWVEPRWRGGQAVLGAALVMAAVGSYCAWLCSGIDAKFGFFGGSENTALFIASGIVPAVLGGLLYGWLVYGPAISTEPDGA